VSLKDFNRTIPGELPELWRLRRPSLPSAQIPRAKSASGQSAQDFDEVCDRARLDELRAEGENLLPELVCIFQSESTKGLDELKHALAARDCDVAARIAHTLKGTAGTFGAGRMQDMAARIDKAARAGQADEAAAIYDAFRSECERVSRYLAAELEA
jgi:two-component system, sensor histidine kinase and response regulator